MHMGKGGRNAEGAVCGGSGTWPERSLLTGCALAWLEALAVDRGTHPQPTVLPMACAGV